MTPFINIIIIIIIIIWLYSAGIHKMMTWMGIRLSRAFTDGLMA